MQLHKLIFPCFKFWGVGFFLILEPAIKASATGDQVETKIPSKQGNCSKVCSIVTHNSANPRCSTLPWPTRHQTPQSVILNSSLINHSLGLGLGGASCCNFWRCVSPDWTQSLSRVEKNMCGGVRKDHFRSPGFAKLPACHLMQWRLLLWWDTFLHHDYKS